MDFKQLYIEGMLEQQRLKKESDDKREKSYRGGNAGIMVDGLPANSCARKVIARSEGRFEETDWQTQLMFDMGELNEDRWHKKLELAGVSVASADDLVNAKTPNNILVSGSPDTIVADGKFLIEHKHMSSFWTFRDKVIEGKPSLEHIAQAGFYSMHLDPMPFCVLYTSSVKFSGPAFLTKLVPNPTDPGSENFEYTYYKYSGATRMYKGKQIKVKSKIAVPGHLQSEYPSSLYNTLGADFAEFKNTVPTIVQYDLRWNDDDSISYKYRNKWHKTQVSKQSIMDFYAYVEKCETTKRLPKRPLQLDIKGEAKGFSACDYCSLSEVCDKYEDNYETWLKMAKQVNY